jgi:hypothetical protein
MNECKSNFFEETNSLINPDEFLLNNIRAYHYEVMEEGQHIWMGFYLEDGKIGHLNIFLNGGKMSTRYEEIQEMPQ